MLRILIVEPKTLYREAWYALFLRAQGVGYLQAVRDWSELEGPLDSWDLIYTRCEVIHGDRTPDLLNQNQKKAKTRVASLGCDASCYRKVAYPLFALSDEESPEELFHKFGLQRPKIPFQEKDLSLHLTAKEYQVVQHLIQGKAFKQIAENLEISSSTVQSYKERAMSKLGVTHLSDLAVLCAASGIRSYPCKRNDYQI